jgi:hypothetical protein
MAGDTGQNQEATIFSQAIPNIQSIEVNNTGEILKETVADGVLTAALGTAGNSSLTLSPRPRQLTRWKGLSRRANRALSHRKRPDQVHVKRGPQRGVS